MHSVAVMLVLALHVSKVGLSKEKGKTKHATPKCDVHAYGGASSVWPKRLVRWRHQQLLKSVPSRFLGSSPHWKCANTTGPHTLQ